MDKRHFPAPNWRGTLPPQRALSRQSLLRLLVSPAMLQD